LYIQILLFLSGSKQWQIVLARLLRDEEWPEDEKGELDGGT
jgi:hypothetical protein